MAETVLWCAVACGVFAAVLACVEFRPFRKPKGE